MYKHLYDTIADKWYRKGGTIWFYSDPHFEDADMVHIRANNIGDLEQVKSINRKVGPYDTIVFLGDIGNPEYIKKIRGYKVLIMGNHDAGASNYKKRPKLNKKYDSLEDAEQAWKAGEIDYYQVSARLGIYGFNELGYFDEVYEGILQISPKIVLSHEPIHCDYALNIHGHDHSGWYDIEGSHRINVCAEWINYTPICIKDIVKSGKLKNIPDIHRIAIEKQKGR